MEAIESVDRERAWVATAIAALVALVGGSLAFPRQVWDEFLWHYFWGPVYADANGAVCAVRSGGTTELYSSTAACGSAPGGAIVAEPGYTLVSEVGYMVVLLFALAGVIFLLRRLNITEDRGLFFALVPFMLFGGALRVVEDANDAAAATPGIDPLLSYPWNTLIISPVIYGTVFVLTVAALVGTVSLRRRGYVDGYDRPMAVVGSALLTLTVGYLFVLWLVTDYVDFFPQVLILTLVIASALAYGIYRLVDVVAPSVNEGTRTIGLVVLWGHAIDGVANVIASDWAVALGLPFNYSAKHPANRIIIDITQSVLPGSIATVIGTSWPFLLVKLVVATVVVWVFDRGIFEESTRYALLLLTAIVAVGLGPGTRDMLRATFGI